MGSEETTMVEAAEAAFSASEGVAHFYPAGGFGGVGDAPAVRPARRWCVDLDTDGDSTYDVGIELGVFGGSPGVLVVLGMAGCAEVRRTRLGGGSWRFDVDPGPDSERASVDVTDFGPPGVGVVGMAGVRYVRCEEVLL